MALIEIYHVVADNYAVDTNTLAIKEGMFVALNSTAGVRRVTTGDSGKVLGVAGDTKSTSAAALPGVYPGWQNRVSDSFDETKASGKLTVYHSGGKFATDQFVDSGMTAPGLLLAVSESTGTLTLGTSSGTVKDQATVAMLTRAAGVYPSGVPGTDLNGDMALRGDNSSKFIEFKLLV